MMLYLYEGGLPVEKIRNAWYQSHHDKNFGAFINFIDMDVF